MLPSNKSGVNRWFRWSTPERRQNRPTLLRVSTLWAVASTNGLFTMINNVSCSWEWTGSMEKTTEKTELMALDWWWTWPIKPRGNMHFDSAPMKWIYLYCEHKEHFSSRPHMANTWSLQGGHSTTLFKWQLVSAKSMSQRPHYAGNIGNGGYT